MEYKLGCNHIQLSRCYWCARGMRVVAPTRGLYVVYVWGLRRPSTSPQPLMGASLCPLPQVSDLRRPPGSGDSSIRYPRRVFISSFPPTAGYKRKWRPPPSLCGTCLRGGELRGGPKSGHEGWKSKKSIIPHAYLDPNANRLGW